MSYIINNTRGQIVAVVADGTVNTTATDLFLVGRALTDYGTYENENYVFLLENFANSTAPTQPVLGQLWYNSDTDEILPIAAPIHGCLWPHKPTYNYKKSVLHSQVYPLRPPPVLALQPHKLPQLLLCLTVQYFTVRLWHPLPLLAHLLPNWPPLLL